MKAREIIVLGCLLLFAVSSIAGQIKFRRGGNNVPVAPHGEPLWNMSAQALFVGNSTSSVKIGPFDSYSGPMGYDGRSVPPLTCYAYSLTSQITYDSTGYNPTPAGLTFYQDMYVGGVVIEPLRVYWIAFGDLNGESINDSFYATVSSQSTSGFALVNAFLTYSTQTVLGGKRVCPVSVSVPIVRSGATGATGATGPPGLSNRATINSIMRNISTQYAQSANDAWQWQTNNPNTASPSPMLGFRDYSGYIRMKVDGLGYQTFLSRTTAYQTKIQDVMIALLLNDVTRLKLEPGRMRGYNATGGLRFDIYTGIEKHLGNPASDGLCLSSTAAGVRSWVTCGSGGSGTFATGGPTRSPQYALGNTTLGGMALMRYTAVTRSGATVTQDGWIMSGSKAFTMFYRNAANATKAIFSASSSNGGSVVIGGS